VSRVPVVVYGVLFLTVALYLLSLSARETSHPCRAPGPPSGRGFPGCRSSRCCWLFLNEGVVPLVVGCLFLSFWATNVKIGWGGFRSFSFISIARGRGLRRTSCGKVGMPARSLRRRRGGGAGRLSSSSRTCRSRCTGWAGSPPSPPTSSRCAWAVGIFLWGWALGPCRTCSTRAVQPAGAPRGICAGTLERLFAARGVTAVTFLPQHPLVPTRRVIFWASKCSRSGMMYFRRARHLLELRHGDLAAS